MTYIVGYMFVHNEEDFLEISLPNAARKVDKLFLIDTGSTDKSIDIINNSKLTNIELLFHEQTEKRYEWDEGAMRNYAMKICEQEKPDYIYYQDPDELIDCNLHELAQKFEHPYFTFEFIDIVYRKYVEPFGFHKHVRFFVPEMFNHQCRNHSVLSFNHIPLSINVNIVEDVVVFHLHRYNNKPKKDEKIQYEQVIGLNALKDIPKEVKIIPDLEKFWEAKSL